MRPLVTSNSAHNSAYVSAELGSGNLKHPLSLAKEISPTREGVNHIVMSHTGSLRDFAFRAMESKVRFAGVKIVRSLRSVQAVQRFALFQPGLAACVLTRRMGFAVKEVAAYLERDQTSISTQLSRIT